MIVGIDIGTQSLKAVVINESMKILGEAASGYAPSFPQPGWAEQDPALWEKGLLPAITGALKNAGVSPHEIRALGVAGQLDGCLPISSEGQPLYNCLIWMDRRAEQELIRLQGIDAGTLHKVTGITMDASHLAAKVLWLQRNIPESKEAFCFHQPSERKACL